MENAEKDNHHNTICNKLSYLSAVLCCTMLYYGVCTMYIGTYDYAHMCM